MFNYKTYPNRIMKISSCLFTLLLLAACGNETENQIIVTLDTTPSNLDRTFTSIKIAGSVTSEELGVITTRGVCWSTRPNPTIDDNKVELIDNQFETTVSSLIVGVEYYFRVFAVSNGETFYSTEQTFSTLSLDDSSWKFTTVYSTPAEFLLYSQVDFFQNKTTRFDEMDYPMHCPGCYITLGSWSLDGNTLTYIWEGSDSELSTYVYTGVVSEMTIQGTYRHSSLPDGIWSAEPF